MEKELHTLCSFIFKNACKITRKSRKKLFFILTQITKNHFKLD